MFAERCTDGGSHLRFNARRCVAARVNDFERERFSLANDCRRIIEERAKAIGIERRRHRDQTQLGAQRFRGVERERQRQIVVEATLVHLVEQHRRNACQLGIILDAREKDAVRHGDHACRFADLAVEPSRVADPLTRFLAERRCHELGGGPSG